jgi:hypothetical protein
VAVKSSGGTTLESGSTPLTYIGDGNAVYTATVPSDSGTFAFDHWSNGDTTPSTSITLTSDNTLTAFYTVSSLPKPPTGQDRFGVEILYQTSTAGREWYANWDNGHARTIASVRSDPDDLMFEARGQGSVSIDGQGMASMSGSQPRMYVNQLAQKWQPNLEITVYMKRMTDASTAWGGSVLSWGNHRDESSNGNCGVDTYYSRVRHDGNLDIEKEVDHPASNVFSGAVKKWSALPHDEWIGHKFILKKMSNGDMKLEKWLDENANQNWVKVQEVTDSGMTGVRASGCTDDLSRVLNAPQESVFIRNTDITLAQYKWFSIREIAAVP